MKVKIKRLHPNAVIPYKASEFAGCDDAVVTEIIKKSEDFVICKLGFALELPENMELVLVPRSSITNTKWVMQNSPGQGDPDYRGEYQIRFRAFPTSVYIPPVGSGNKINYPEFPYKEGESIGQLYLREVIPIEWEEVEELSDTVRGSGGFGSTNKK